jgi:hypothetical protein
MSKIDYSSLINGDEEEVIVQETPAAFNLTRAVNWTTWGTQTGHSDDKFSVIDKKKNIEINEEQVNVTQEHRAQYIPFEMDRFYDGIDFAYKSISIQYERADGQGAEDVAVNTQYSEDKIRFGWLLKNEATSAAGDLNFEIHVSGYGPDE